MGVDLHSIFGRCYFRFNILAWPNVLALAKQYGWKPLGTDRPWGDDREEFWRVHRWDETDYSSSEGQIVTGEDAKAIADALELALRDMEGFTELENPGINDAIAKNPLLIALGKVFNGPGNDLEVNLYQTIYTSPLAFLKGGGEETLKKFIEFCRKGDFIIW